MQYLTFAGETPAPEIDQQRKELGPYATFVSHRLASAAFLDRDEPIERLVTELSNRNQWVTVVRADPLVTSSLFTQQAIDNGNHTGDLDGDAQKIL